MEPEVYFIKYGYPCAHILCTVRGDVSEEKFKEMEQAAIQGKVMDRAYLEKVFFRAFDRIKKIAEEMGKDKWDVDVIREYFCVRHNSVLMDSDYPESFKEMCKTYKAEIVSEEEDGEVVVSYVSEDGKEKKRKVKKDYFPELKVGDKVWIHWQYAVERCA
ncbi:MAG: hypothetical protein ABIH92_01175 [Nanoarchaeota archaeon]